MRTTDKESEGEKMTLDDIKKLPVYQTRGTADACKDAATLQYISECLQRFYAGDYGEIDAEDTEANNMDLAQGCGHILARYKGKGYLKGDIYIEAHFDKDLPGNLDANNTFIMYPDER